MSTVVRVALIAVSIAGLLVALGYYVHWPGLEQLWPWWGVDAGESAGPRVYQYDRGSTTDEAFPQLSFYFLSSIAAAIALPNLWIGLTREFAAIFGGAFNLTIVMTALTVFLLLDYAELANGRLLVAAGICASGALTCAALVWWSGRRSFRDRRPTPAPVRWSFLAFAVTLVLVGGALVFERPHVFPWPLSRETSVVYGWIFLGAAAYFSYGLLVPLRSNAVGQLLGFLAYDVVLIKPYLAHFETVAPEHVTSLVVYTLVISFSGLLAIYYLFVHSGTRLRFSSLTDRGAAA